MSDSQSETPAQVPTDAQATSEAQSSAIEVSLAQTGTFGPALSTSNVPGFMGSQLTNAGISGSTEPEFAEASPEVPNPVTEDGGILWQGAGQADEVFPGASALYARIAELEDELDTYIHKFAALEQKVKSALSHIGLDVKKFF